MAPMQLNRNAGSTADDRFSPEQVRAELERVLESPAFKATPQRRRMLTYVVEEMLAGRGQEIKGYAIGIHAFDRGDNFDPNSDPLVRLEARRLRHDLDSYYVSEGRNDPLRISIPTGRYVPEITDQKGDAGEGGATGIHMPNGENPKTRIGQSYWAAGAIAAAIAMATIAYWMFLHPGKDAEAAAPLAPAVAVLPFEILSESERDRFLGAGIASQIVADLNRFPDIRIFITQNGFSEGATATPTDMEKRLGVSYAVAGELRSDPSSINVVARLIDAKSGEILWSDSFHRELAPANLIALQSEIAAGIATTLGQPYGIIRSNISRDLRSDDIPSMSSYECVLRAYHFRRTYSPALYPPTLACLERAIQTDPDYAEAWAMLGFFHFISTALSILPADPAKNFRTGAEAARHSIEIDPDNVLGLKVLSAINHYQGNYAQSERYVRLALEKNPNDPDTLYQLAWRLAIRGRFEEGIPLLKLAIERTVNPPPPYFHLMAIDRLMKGDGEGMLAFANRAAVDGSAMSQSFLAAANNLLGNRVAAARAIARMNEITPGYDAIDRLRGHQATDEILNAMTAALHQ